MRTKANRDHQRLLRNSQTEAEHVLWQHLRNRRLHGWKFRRQHRIGRYIADFACLERGLVVELDGSQHLDAADQDAVRTRFLAARGFRVVRFWNDDVLRETEAVLAAIATALAPHPPSGHLLPACGEKEKLRPACGEKEKLGPACGQKGKHVRACREKGAEHRPACGLTRAPFSASRPRGRSGRRSG